MQKEVYMQMHAKFTGEQKIMVHLTHWRFHWPGIQLKPVVMVQNSFSSFILKPASQLAKLKTKVVRYSKRRGKHFSMVKIVFGQRSVYQCFEKQVAG